MKTRLALILADPPSILPRHTFKSGLGDDPTPSLLMVTDPIGGAGLRWWTPERNESYNFQNSLSNEWKAALNRARKITFITENYRFY